MMEQVQNVKSSVRINSLQWDTKGQRIIVEGEIIALTSTEYRVCFVLRHGIPVTYEDVAKFVYNTDMDNDLAASIRKHVDRIRLKLEGTGVHIYCVLEYGYVLLPRKGWHHD